MNKLLFLFTVILLSNRINAQPQQDSTVKHSTVKTLTDRQYNALLNGEDLYGMVLAAKLNHYPYPVEVIKFKDELNLSPIQVDKITAINKELHRKILEMGLIIIHNERTLDSLFRTHRVNNGSLIFYTNRYGLYQGELRNAILQTCLTTRALLTPQQINKFEALRKAK